MEVFDGFGFWQNINMLLDQRRMTNIQLAERAGLSYRTITTQRNRHSLPGSEQLYCLSKALEIPMEELLTGRADSSSTSPEAIEVDKDPVLRKIVSYLLEDRSRIDSLVKLFNLQTEKRDTSRLA